jgi:hypothetical protein
LLDDQPGKSAPEAFPQAARANRSLFFDAEEETGARPKALSVAEVHARIGGLIDKRVARYASVRDDFTSFQLAAN